MSLNPFDLPGPEFLIFYVILGIVTLGTLNLAVRGKEAPPDDRDPPITDPFLIAALNGGARAAIDVAMVSLIDRGLLQVDDTGAVTATRPPELFSMRRIERAMLELFQKRGRVYDAYQDERVLAACDAYRETLEQDSLVLSARAREWRIAFALLAVLLLGLTAAAKIVLALSRGHGNVLFLILLAGFFCYAAFKAIEGRHTARGKALLRELRVLFQRLDSRASGLRPGQSSNDLAFATALFGTGILPPDVFPYIETALPKPPPKPAKSESSGGSGCSSCSGGWGSSSSSCGSSSCSGGCGGGCGGCGG